MQSVHNTVTVMETFKHGGLVLCGERQVRCSLAGSPSARTARELRHCGVSHSADAAPHATRTYRYCRLPYTCLSHGAQLQAPSLHCCFARARRQTLSAHRWWSSSTLLLTTEQPCESEQSLIRELSRVNVSQIKNNNKQRHHRASCRSYCLRRLRRAVESSRGGHRAPTVQCATPIRGGAARILCDRARVRRARIAGLLELAAGELLSRGLPPPRVVSLVGGVHPPRTIA